MRATYGLAGLILVAGQLPAPQAWATPMPGEISVAGNHLLRDGKKWIPHGYVQVAFVKPPGIEDTNPVFGVAARNYSPEEYTEMRFLGADSVRIQMSQPGLDPDNSLRSEDFRDRVVAAVRAARTAGLSVIICVQDEAQSGQGPDRASLPNDATQRVWRELAPAFDQDRGVVFELFNEPDLRVSAANWQAWADAMNRTIRTVRTTGATNVVVADGLEYAEQLEGAPRLDDPFEQVAYASHPYAHDAANQAPPTWDAKFGLFARTAPVIVTEWTAPAYFCNAETPGSVVSFLQYLQSRGIGLEVVTWDWSTPDFGSAIYDFPHSRLSTFVGPSGPLACHAAGSGPGALVECWYLTGTPPASVF